MTSTPLTKCDECGRSTPVTVGWGNPLPGVGPKQLCLDCFGKACAKVGEILERAKGVLDA